MRIVWSPTLPPVVRSVVQPLIERALVFAPAWVSELTVLYDDEDAGVAALMTTSPEYRRLTLTIKPAILNVHENAWEIIVHEFAHAFTNPASAAGQNAIKDIVGADFPTPGSNVAYRFIKDIEEGSTCDLAELLLRLVPNGAP